LSEGAGELSRLLFFSSGFKVALVPFISFYSLVVDLEFLINFLGVVFLPELENFFDELSPILFDPFAVDLSLSRAGLSLD